MNNVPEKIDKGSKVNLPHYREKLEAILNDCYAKNIIELDELETRLDRVQDAKTTRELEKIVDDLPTIYKNKYYSNTSLSDAETFQTPSSGARQSVISVMGDKIFRGPSLSGTYTKVTSVMSNCTIDLRNIRFRNNKTEIKLLSVMSNLTIIVPEHSILHTEFSSIMSSHKESQDVNRSADSDELVIRITGKCIMSNIVIQTG